MQFVEMEMGERKEAKRRTKKTLARIELQNVKTLAGSSMRKLIVWSLRIAAPSFNFVISPSAPADEFF